LVTAAPDPVLLQRLPLIFIMSQAWSEAHGTTVPAADDEQSSYANLHANGTGPFRVVERDTDTLTVLAPHEGWWGEVGHNLTRVEFRPITSDATRVAALLSGDVDLIFPVPPQDIERIDGTEGFRVLQGPSLMTIHFGMDQWRDELLDMPGSGQNPFRDRRLREAFHRAIDIDAIRDVTMRGAATPAGLLIAPGIAGFDAELTEEFFRAVANSAKLTLHIWVRSGNNAHHMIEACFKAFARALRVAISIDPDESGVPSTKGTLNE